MGDFDLSKITGREPPIKTHLDELREAQERIRDLEAESSRLQSKLDHAIIDRDTSMERIRELEAALDWARSTSKGYPMHLHREVPLNLAGLISDSDRRIAKGSGA